MLSEVDKHDLHIT